MWVGLLKRSESVDDQGMCGPETFTSMMKDSHADLRFKDELLGLEVVQG